MRFKSQSNGFELFYVSFWKFIRWSPARLYTKNIFLNTRKISYDSSFAYCSQLGLWPKCLDTISQSAVCRYRYESKNFVSIWDQIATTFLVIYHSYAMGLGSIASFFTYVSYDTEKTTKSNCFQFVPRWAWNAQSCINSRTNSNYKLDRFSLYYFPAFAVKNQISRRVLWIWSNYTKPSCCITQFKRLYKTRKPN